MVRKIILFSAAFLVTSTGHAMNVNLPYPPAEFFQKLAKTELPPGRTCCGELREILCKTIFISAEKAASLFRQGKLILVDTRMRKTYNSAHVFGAISLPYNELSQNPYMKVNLPRKTPIALY
jgi:hypothetical protein